MQYEPLTRQSAGRFLPGGHDIFRAASRTGPLLEWRTDEAGDELLMGNGSPLVRLWCRNRRWFLSVIGSDAPPLRSGSRAEAQQLAVFYARRTVPAGQQPA